MTDVIQVTNVAPAATTEQMKTLFGFLGKIDDVRMFPPDDSPLPVSSRVCFVKYQDIVSVGVAQHLTNTVFIDRALIVVPYSEGKIPDESKALSLLAPASAVAGLLPTPNPLASMGAVPLAALGALHGTGGCLDPTLAALGIPQPALLGGTVDSCKLDEIRRSVYVGNLTAHQSGGTDHLLNLFSQVGDLKMNSATATVIKPAVKNDSKEIEEAMKRVREAQSLISAAIDPDSAQKKDDKKKRSRSRSRSRRRRSRSRSRRRRSRSRSRRRSRDRRRSPRRRSRTPHRRTRSPRRRSRDRERDRDRDRERERDRVRRSPTPAKSRGPAFSVLLKSRDKRREERGEKKRRSKTPPRSYSSLRRSRSASRSPIPKSHSPRRRISRTPPAIKMRSPKRKASRSPSPKKHKKEKKRDKGRDRSRDRDLRSSGKKKKSKDKDRSRDRREKVDLEKSDVKGGQVIRNYDEEEMGYDSERGAGSTEGDGGVSPRDFASGPESRGVSPERSPGSSRNGDDVRYVDMDGSN